MPHPLKVRLGRIPSTDPQSYAFSMEAHLLGFAPEDLPRHREWTPGPVLDQGDTSECTAYSWRAHLNAEPHAHPDLGPAPHDLYLQEKEIDGLGGGDGSTVLAGAKILRKLGVIESYYWAHAEWTVRKWVLLNGPVALGVDWYEGMYQPNPRGVVTISGNLEGGHAFEVIGYDAETKLYKCQNSWGIGWGVDGFFYITVGDMARLLAEGGEACDSLNWKGVP